MNEDEVFHPIIDSDGVYEANRLGVVRSVDRYGISKLGKPIFKKGVILKPQMNSTGYWFFNLRIPGKYRKESLHRIMAKLFIPNPNNYPEVNHINGIRSDSRLENLEWVTHQQNLKHAYSYGKTIHSRKLTADQVSDIYYNTKLVGKVYSRDGSLTLVEMGEKHGIKRSQVSQIVWQKSYLELTSKFDYIPITRNIKQNKKNKK